MIKKYKAIFGKIEECEILRETDNLQNFTIIKMDIREADYVQYIVFS